MKVAIIGSRSFTDFDLTPYIPEGITEIVSGGAIGVDTIAKKYALTNNIRYTEFPPDYPKFGKIATLMRNLEIIDYSDLVLAFWDGISHGTKFVIDNCKKIGVDVRIFVPTEDDSLI